MAKYNHIFGLYLVSQAIYNHFMTSVSAELSRGVLHAADLRERLGVSPATLMRMVRDAGQDVVRIGRGRATRYALRQQWPNLDSSRFPLFRITDTGAAVSAGELMTLAARQSVWMPAGRVSDGLPIELVDARPFGILGATLRRDSCRSSAAAATDRLVGSSHPDRDVSSRRGPSREPHRRRGILCSMASAGRCRRNPQRLPDAGRRHNRWTSPWFISGRRAAEVRCAR